MNQSDLQVLQDELAKIWQESLEVPEIGPEDDFFELGGHSLISLEIRAAIRKLLKAPQLRIDVLDTPTIATMAEAIVVQLGAAAAA